MTKTLGIDPGVHGALVIYDDVLRTLSCWDMPVWYQVVGKKKRLRVDAVELASMMEMAKDIGVDLAIMESIGGMARGRQSGQLAFGYSIGLLYMGLITCRIPIETIHPATWKKAMRVPKDEGGIAVRFDEMFPEFRALIRGPRGAIKHDRAEASILAKFGAEHLFGNIRPDAEWRLAGDQLRKAETGA